MRKTIHILLMAMAVLVGCTRDEPEPVATRVTGDSTLWPEQDTVVINFDSIDTATHSTVEVRNLMLNSSLEHWVIMNNGVQNPDHWLCHNNYNVQRDSVMVTDGHYSARMQSTASGSTAKVAQVVPVKSGDSIRIRFSYRIGQWKEHGARTYCYFRSSSTQASRLSADELRAFYTDEEYYILRGGGRGLKYLPHEMDVWLTFDETIAVPPNATHFEFGINSYYGTTLYVDDCGVMGVDN